MAAERTETTSPPPPARDRVLIVGAGLAGSLAASFLARRGYRVTVHERRPDPRDAGFVGGRSINLALSVRGIDALERVGMAERVLRDAVPMRGRMMHAVAGELAFQPYSSDPQEFINSVSRGGLNVTLIDAAEATGSVEFRFNRRCVDVDPFRAEATFRDETTGAEDPVGADVLIGADGAFSAVRGAMQKTDRFDYEQAYLAHGYKELSIPPAAELAPGAVAETRGRWAMEPNALHIWPRGGSMMIALPNADGSFTCTIFWPFEGEHSFASIASREDVVPFFERWYPDAVPLMPTLEEDFMRNPTSSLVTVRCRPWHVGRAVLIGDAAHAIVPFYGQGMNAAFEDCVLLDEALAAHPEDPVAAFERFERGRKPDADAIADLAIANFLEMRDKVGSRAFRWGKRLERGLHRAFPRRFVPLYNLVSFSRTSYAAARARARRQWRTVGLVAGLVALGLLAVLIGAWAAVFG